MENTEQPSKTNSLQLILGSTALVLLTAKYILKWKEITFLEYQGSLLTFLGFTLFCLANYLKYRELEYVKNKKTVLWTMIALGSIALIALNELSKFFI